MMQFDKDADGKLKREELPEGMRRMFDRLDTNSDGFIDKSEIDAMMKRFSGGGGRGSSGDPGSRGQRSGGPGGTP